MNILRKKGAISRRNRIIHLREQDISNLKAMGIRFRRAEKDRLRLNKELTEWQERAKRLAAELDNFRKRAEKEKMETRQYAIASTVQHLLGFDELFSKALSGLTGSDKNNHTIMVGIKMIGKEFDNLLSSLGIAKIPTVGETFNPSLHEAIDIEESSEYKPNTILKELRPGYTLEGKLLRAAQVKIAKEAKTSLHKPHPPSDV